MMKKFVQRWKQYRYRFVPWMAVNITESSPRIVTSLDQDHIIADDCVTEIIQTLFSEFQTNYYQSGQNDLQAEATANLQSMYSLLGFTVEKGPSKVEHAGTGVFVSRGDVPKGCIVAMYPGLVYHPWEPVFLVSLANQFLFRCADGKHIDGKHWGLSKMMYNSSAQRDASFNIPRCDVTWMGSHLINPLAVGQFVNNQNNEFSANVAYQEYDVPSNFPSHYMRYIPNIEARLQQDRVYITTDSLLRTVMLVALRDICEGEELFSTYYTIVKSTEKTS